MPYRKDGKPRTDRVGMTYVVYWREHQVLKVGRAYRAGRVRHMQASGAEVLVLIRDTPPGWERAVLAAFNERFRRAFICAEESKHLLRSGRGFTECFNVFPSQLGAAVTLFRGAIADAV